MTNTKTCNYEIVQLYHKDTQNQRKPLPYFAK